MSKTAIILTVVAFVVLLVLGGMLAKIVVGRRREAGWARRSQQLLGKYQDPDIVEKIMTRMIWKHMTRDQLLDSWGPPAQQDHGHGSSGAKEILRYRPMKGRPQGQRVILENGVVVGWDTKTA